MRTRARRAASCGIVLLLTFFAAGGVAHGRELTDILTEKGVLTPEEAAEAAQTPPKQPTFQYKPGSGFVFTTADGDFQLATGVWGQFRYTLTDVDEHYTSGRRNTEDSQSFDIPRARVYWKGHAFTPRLRYEIEIELNAGAGDLMRNVYAEYQLVTDQWLTFRVGQWKVPFCRQEMTPDSKQEFNERSVACQNFRFERDRGIQLFGTPQNSLVEYYAGVFNGTGRNGPSNPDNNFLYVARLATNPLGAVGYSEGDLADTPDPLFGIGISYGYERARADEFTSAATAGVDPDDPEMMVLTSDGQPQNRVPVLRMIQPFYSELSRPSALTAELSNLEADFAFRWRGLFVQGEYYHAWIHNDAHASAASPSPPFELPQTSFQAWGYYAQAGYFVIPKKLELAIRYSEFTPNEDFRVTKANGRRITPSQSELLGAVNYYFWGHDLKLMTDFGPVTTEGIGAIDSDVEDRDDFRWRVQAQMYF